MLRSFTHPLTTAGSVLTLAAVLGLFGCAPGGSDTASADAGHSDDAGDLYADASSTPEERPVVATPVPTERPLGPVAPDFRIAGLDGSVITQDDFVGQVVLIDFWATWCGPCRMAIPHLVELQEELGPRGFTVLGVSVDRKGPDVVKAFGERAGINYPMAMGNAAMSRAYGGPQGITSIPTAFLIDRSGRVAKKIRGFQPKEALLRDILPLLDETDAG
jgi:thiol-disulfide isomerase/thioredoxin